MDLLSKYNIPAPRYTSYPPVPYWETMPDEKQWRRLVADSFSASNQGDGIGIYIHLPFCESLCTYCACNTRITVNHKVEEPYINAVLKEWNIYLGMFGETPRIRQLHLGGGTPTFFSPANLARLIEGLLKTASVCGDADLSFEGHPNNTTAEHLAVLRSLGFNRVSFGIQDFDPRVQEAIHRFQPLENVQRAVNAARENGYASVNFDLVFGLPFQTEKSVTDTMRTVLALRPDRIAYYSYAHVPWLKPAQKKFSPAALPDPALKKRLYEIGKEMLLAEGYRDVGMDHFAVPGDALFSARENRTLHRNFMGYSPVATKLTIGLGASAISDTWTGFSQNAKSAEIYSGSVNAGAIPTVKGHILTPRDLMIRRHILDIMCFYETRISLGRPENGGILERLREMAADGIVRVDGDLVTVTGAGHPFLRNICLAFDERHWNKTTEARFSAVA
jgi:oxygen-independent coproporphyrinogen III oxidase